VPRVGTTPYQTIVGVTCAVADDATAVIAEAWTPACAWLSTLASFWANGKATAQRPAMQRPVPVERFFMIEILW
jgi:hypothetical protein